MKNRWSSLSHRIFAAASHSIGIFIAGGVLANQFGCAASTHEIQDISRLVDAKTKAEEGLWSIVVGSDALLQLPILPDPTHNFIGILDHEEENFMTIHGLGIDRKSGATVRMPDNTHAIFAVIDGDYVFGYNMQLIFAANEVAVLEPKEALRKCMIMMDAMHCINRQNLAYDMFELFGRGQNSNSVAYTLVKAAGYEIPKGNLGQLEHGHGRWLLPEGWQSYYEDWIPPEDSEEFMRWYISQMRYMLETVTEEIAASGQPPAGRRLFFDPENPFVPYEPLVIADAEEKWQAYKERMAEETLKAEEAKKALEADQNSETLNPDGLEQELPQPGPDKPDPDKAGPDSAPAPA